MQHRLLRAQQQGGRGLPLPQPQHHRGRLHQPAQQQQQPLLPRPPLKRQQKLNHREHKETHRQRYL